MTSDLHRTARESTQDSAEIKYNYNTRRNCAMSTQNSKSIHTSQSHRKKQRAKDEGSLLNLLATDSVICE